MKQKNSSTNLVKKTHINQKQYNKLYEQSIKDLDGFWGKQALQFISWFSSWQKTINSDSSLGENTQWFTQGKLNACYNCVDRHLSKRSNQTAIIWEGNDPSESKQLTYQQLHDEVAKFGNVLRHLGIKKGDRVCIYLPMIPEAIVAMLACARIGAIHSVVFAGFSPESLKNRILDADCRLVITADQGFRGEKIIPLKENCDIALQSCDQVQHLIVIKRTGIDLDWHPSRDIWYHQAMQKADTHCPIETMDSADPLFILYTSGSTGKPKGIVHSTGGYMVYVAMTHHYVFDYHEGDIFWCSADIGWITGHSYLVYGPLANGATTLLFEGVPHYPDFSRYWQIVDKHQVNIFYTSPTAIRALRREGDAWVQSTQRKSLKLLGTVGEPINPEAWQWYYDIVGEQRCPIVNTWWQTETGGILLTQLPGATPMIPGSVGQPFFGIVPDIVNDQGISVEKNTPGYLVIKKPWPGLMQTIYGDRQRFITSYLTQFPHCFFTGDGAHQQENGDFWITGRIDDVLNISGHRIGTEEVESALVSHSAVSEAAVVGIPNDIKGEGIYAFVATKIDIIPNDDLKKELINQVRIKIGPIATPEVIQWVNALPKTRSGKIMRRILRKIARHDISDLGDISTLADSSVIEKLIEGSIIHA